jgi:hypothetical protein
MVPWLLYEPYGSHMVPRVPLEITVINKIPGENIHAGTLFLTVRKQGLARIFSLRTLYEMSGDNVDTISPWIFPH